MASNTYMHACGAIIFKREINIVKFNFYKEQLLFDLEFI